MKLVENTIYFGDNGRAMCSRCAGATASASGTHDLSGTRLQKATLADADYFAEEGLTLSCECGRITIKPTKELSP